MAIYTFNDKEYLGIRIAISRAFRAFGIFLAKMAIAGIMAGIGAYIALFA